MPGVQVRCLVERVRNRLTRHASQVTAAATRVCRDNSRRWSAPPDRQSEFREAKLWDTNGPITDRLNVDMLRKL